METPSLYRRLLGDAYERLGAAARGIHDRPEGSTLAGTFRVERGQGWLRRLAAAVMGMPAAAEAVPIRLTITREGDRERWTREIGTTRLVSVQWARNGLLHERFGPYRFIYRLTVDGGGLTYTQVAARFLGVPVPGLLAIRTSARTRPTPDGWEVDSVVTAPLLGFLARYTGPVRPA